MSGAQWEQFNCYKELEISPAASLQDIRRARNEAASRHHPDRGGAHEAQIRINIAYQVLSNPITRQSHDIHWGIFEPGWFAPTTKSQDSAQLRVTESEPLARGEPLGGFRRRVYNEVEKQKGIIWGGLQSRKQKNEDELLIRYSNQCKRDILTFIDVIVLQVL